MKDYKLKHVVKRNKISSIELDDYTFKKAIVENNDEIVIELLNQWLAMIEFDGHFVGTFTNLELHCSKGWFMTRETNVVTLYEEKVYYEIIEC